MMEGAVEDLEMAVEEEAGEEVGEPAEGEVEVTLKAVEAVGSQSGKTSKEVKIVDSGEIEMPPPEPSPAPDPEAA